MSDIRIRRDVEDILKELGPKETEVVRKVFKNLQSYSQMYQYMMEYILVEYKNIDENKIAKISSNIDYNLSYLGDGEKLFIYNKLERPFIVDFYKKELKDEKYLKNLWIDEINSMILSIHPDMDMKQIEKTKVDIKEKLEDLRYEEKWSIYNALAHMIFNNILEAIKK